MLVFGGVGHLEGEQLQLVDLQTVVLSHLLNGMILQAGSFTGVATV